ncbi:hypothetical protein BRARA_H00379 [Brassica rapa]|uniref:Uncharacterized protein n=1 Tax=Brassica campestris TaxID=3711 RepID=A0A397Y7N7_BRACM|nr:hypothetical protein BRARA_H00379 [Brassica rapa]
MSFNFLSSASKACLCVIGASSQIIRSIFSIGSANIVPGLMVQSLSSESFKGILKRECVVLPLGSSNAYIIEEAISRTICFLDPILDIMVWYRNVFHVPHAPYTKNSFPSILST